MPTKSGLFVMNAEVEELIKEIEAAFDGVPKPQEVTMRVARGLDDYADDEELAQLRKLDTEERWQDISDDDVEKYADIFPFLEPDGFRYYLPRYMILALKNYEEGKDTTVGDLMIYACCNFRPGRYYLWQYTDLDRRQKQVVTKFLKFCIADEGMRFHSKYAEKAYKKFWCKFDKDE